MATPHHGPNQIAWTVAFRFLGLCAFPNGNNAGLQAPEIPSTSSRQEWQESWVIRKNNIVFYGQGRKNPRKISSDFLRGSYKWHTIQTFKLIMHKVDLFITFKNSVHVFLLSVSRALLYFYKEILSCCQVLRLTKCSLLFTGKKKTSQRHKTSGPFKHFLQRKQWDFYITM